jgi:nucleotide-binding universal stress UspA family protein
MKANRNEILVPVNFKPEAFAALDNTYKLIKFLNAKLVLLYVVAPVDFIHELLHKKEELEDVMLEAQTKIDELAKKVREKTGIEVQTIVKRGKIYEKIIETSNEINARYIIMGKRVPESNEERFLGSIITQVIKRAKVPVITMKGTTECCLDYNSILLPLDLTKSTKEQVFNAISFALHFNARIHIVSILMGGIKIWKSRIYIKMKRVARMIKENGIDCSMEIYKRTDESMSQLILKHAAYVKADMIIIMTHQEAVTNDNYIGAVATTIVSESDIPVLTLTSAAAKADKPSSFEMVKPVWDPLGIFKKKRYRK